MRLGRRTVLALMFALICFNVLVRLPRTDHESGVDSFAIHLFATAITDQGKIPWILNPLGYFGWYPLSYPSAAPVLISGVGQMAGLPEEGAILALDLLYGVIGALGGFVMARAFRRDDVFGLLAAATFSLAPRFVSFTLWSGSSRNLFMVMIPFFLWGLVRSYRKPSLPNIAVLILVLIFMLGTHRLTILLAVVVIAFIIAYVFVLLHRVARIRFPKVLLSTRIRRWTPRMALIGIAGIAVVMIAGTQVLAEYTQGEICTGQTLQAELCNLGISITRSVGLALPFALVGVFALVRERNKGLAESFLVFALLALIPTLFLRQYTGFYILPFLALFAAFGIVGLLDILTKHRRARNAIAVACVLGISAFSVAVLQVEVERGTVISEANYTTALYLQSLPEGNFVANDGLTTIRIAAVSGRGGLPVGGAGTTSQSPEILIMGAYNASEIRQRERRIPLTELTIEADSPFSLENLDALSDWQHKILWLDVDSPGTHEMEGRYSLQYYLELNEIRGAYYGFGNTYSGVPFSNFALSVHEKRYRLYNGTTEDLYLVFPPLEG